MANSAKIGGLNIDLTELSADTSPQLGGNLDLNSNDITGTGNVNTTGTITSSGAITSSGTVTGSTFSGSGASLTNLPSAQLTGALPAIDGSSLTGINTDLVSDTTPQLGGNLDAQSNNITNLGTINTHTIPGGTGTLALTSDITHTPSSTDTLTNKTINLSSNTLSGTTAQFNTALSDGSFRIGYQPGEIIECLTGTCDGRTIVGQSGSYTWPNGTQQVPSTSYVDMEGSSISYTPPTGTNHVKYEFHFHASYYATTAPLYHLRFYYDGTEVTHGRYSQYMYYDDRKHYVMALSLNNSTPSVAAGKIGTWNTAKVMKIQIRAYTTSFRPDIHSTHYFDGGGSRQFVRPTLTITAIA